MTVQDLITTGMKGIGALAAGETPTADETADGFACLNRMVDSWATERLTVYTVTRTTWAIAANDGVYTLGLTGDIAIARPVHLQRIKVIDTSQTPDLEMDLGPLLTDQAYAAIAAKALTAVFPSCAYYNPTYPLGTITFWPVPTSTTLQGVIYAWAPVTQFAATTTTIALPPGYESALVANFEVAFARQFGRPVPGDLAQEARDTKYAIKVSNYRPVPLRPDPALIGSGGFAWDINTDQSAPVG